MSRRTSAATATMVPQPAAIIRIRTFSCLVTLMSTLPWCVPDAYEMIWLPRHRLVASIQFIRSADGNLSRGGCFLFSQVL